MSNTSSKLGIITNIEPGTVKIIDKKDEHYYQLPVEKTHTNDELAALHRAIRYTKAFKSDEAEARALEVEPIERILRGV